MPSQPRRSCAVMTRLHLLRGVVRKAGISGTETHTYDQLSCGPVEPRSTATRRQVGLVCRDRTSVVVGGDGVCLSGHSRQGYVPAVIDRPADLVRVLPRCQGGSIGPRLPILVCRTVWRGRRVVASVRHRGVMAISIGRPPAAGPDLPSSLAPVRWCDVQRVGAFPRAAPR
jgi:hypothetical protein